MEMVKKIVNVIVMLLITILGMITIWCIGIGFVITPNGIKTCMNKSGYYSKIEEKLNSEFSYYLNEDKVKDMLVKIPAKENVDYILTGIDDQTVKERAENVKQEVKNIIFRDLSDLSSDENVELFSENMSEKYVKTILPISQLDKYSEVYAKYINKLHMVTICSLTITIIMIIIAFLSKDSSKFGIIALYNVIIFSVFLICIMFLNSNIALGDIKLVIQQMLHETINAVILELLLVVLSLGVANYFVFFTKKSETSSHGIPN